MNDKSKVKLAGGVAAGVVLVGALGAAGAVAADRVLSGDDRQAVIDDAAAQLGVTPAELESALEEGLKNRVDEAVQEGRLTEEQGQELKERIEAGATPFLGLGFGHGPFGFAGPVQHSGKLDLEAAAAYLGLTTQELMNELGEGKTLAEIAQAEGKTVDGLVQELVDAAEKRIDEAVAEGRLTQEQATEIEEGLEERIRERVNEGFRFHRFGGHPGPFGLERPTGFGGGHG